MEHDPLTERGAFALSVVAREKLKTKEKWPLSQAMEDTFPLTNWTPYKVSRILRDMREEPGTSRMICENNGYTQLHAALSQDDQDTIKKECDRGFWITNAELFMELPDDTMVRFLKRPRGPSVTLRKVKEALKRGGAHGLGPGPGNSNLGTQLPRENPHHGAAYSFYTEAANEFFFVYDKREDFPKTTMNDSLHARTTQKEALFVKCWELDA